jgi:hypothetical protein
MPTKHFKYGGSTATRTLACPPWRRTSANMPQGGGGSNEFADRGTLLHNAMEALGTTDVKIEDLIGSVYNDQILTEEMLEDIVRPTWDAYEKFAVDNEFGLELFEIEVKDDEEVGGTVDIMACNEDTIFILDWKFGHALVSPVENAQGLFYAMCAQQDEKTAKLFTPERTKLVIGIIQPAYGDIGESVIQTWECDIKRLNEFADDFYTAIDVRAVTEEPCSGSHCKYCPAITVCPVKTGAARDALLIKPRTAEAAQLSQAMSMVADVEEWCRAVRAQAHEQAEQGLKIDGFKLVNKRASRKWTDENTVADMVRKARMLKIDEAMNMTLKSPAQLEKLCKSKGVDFARYDDYIESVSSGTTLVPASDKRTEVLGLPALASAIASINE